MIHLSRNHLEENFFVSLSVISSVESISLTPRGSKPIFPNTTIAELNVKRFGNINNHARFELFPSFIPTIFFKYLWVYSIAMFQHLSSICHTQTISYLSIHFVITILTVTVYRIINCSTISNNYHAHQHHSIDSPNVFLVDLLSHKYKYEKKSFKENYRIAQYL